MFDLNSIVVDNNGTQLAYIDSGPPLNSTNYVTIFAIHGVIFTALIFKRVMEIAAAANLRIVSVNRRDYTGSTALSPSDLGFIVNGTNSQKAQFLQDRGLELLRFMDIFIETNNLPPVSSDGKAGGSALLGWSLGNSFTIPAIAHASELGAESKSRLSRHLRSLIVQDPPSAALGLPVPGILWLPPNDESMPLEDRVPFTIQWLTSYWDHGNIEQRNESSLSYIVPTTAQVPSIFSMHNHLPSILVPGPFTATGSDWFTLTNLGPQLLETYRRACFSAEVRELFPHLKIWELVGDLSGAFAIDAYWKTQDDDQAAGGGHINFNVLNGTNHFVHWDYPRRTIEAYRRAVQSV
ncbi:hypothetical protein FA15DRAFT_671277 [Coprinopsis marcescibilis]|uniref:AB hydrolase-1 domain-containing protein n=1 Tax=Coprinopsis marcescibilis TaxID=230819 RepID=A0A5C3KS64_COPMA|nr:hypothetical protein FA15DRAFT_671277 [Coprinopsis marcescibilis]